MAKTVRSSGLVPAPKAMLDFDLREEWAFTERLRRAAGVPLSPLVLGIGDDCAIYRPPSSKQDLLFTSDLLVEGVHFTRDSQKPAELGRKALARSLSDIAAMGGEPRFCLLALCAPGWANDQWLNSFCDGLLRLGSESGTFLAGGDLSQGERFSCDVTVAGAVPRGKALLRSGARPGDEIFVSGELGGSALGLESKKGKAWKRHRYPEPRLALGRFLREKLQATSAIDLSDGLSLDLRRLCLASGCAALITEPPRFPGATRSQALHGGEEYELLFTAKVGKKVPPRFEGLRLTRIGVITAGIPGRILLGGEPLEPLGYDHFRGTDCTIDGK